METIIRAKDGRYLPVSLEEIVTAAIVHAVDMEEGHRQVLLEQLQAIAERGARQVAWEQYIAAQKEE